MSDYDIHSRSSTTGGYYTEDMYKKDESKAALKEYKQVNKQLDSRSSYYAGNVADQDKSIRKWGGVPEAEAKLKYPGLASNDRYYKNQINQTYASSLSRPEKKRQYDSYLSDYNKTQDQYASSVASRQYASNR